MVVGQSNDLRIHEGLFKKVYRQTLAALTRALGSKRVIDQFRLVSFCCRPLGKG